MTDFQPKGSTAKNAARDWMRKCLKKNGWPPVYVAEIATWDPKMQTQRLSPLAFILPHEIVFQIAEKEHCGNPLSNRRWHTERHRSCGQSQGMPQRFCHSTGAVVRCNPA